MRFSDIPEFTRRGSYEVHIGLEYLKQHVEEHQKREGLIAGLDLNPDFQRTHVWTDQQRIKFVEYVLRGGQAHTTLYFNCKGWQGNYEGPYVIVDGKQRLHALLKFLNNEIPAFGCYYKDFEGRLPHDRGIGWNVNDLKTRAEVLQWYLEINEGGVVHTKYELEKVRILLDQELKRNNGES